MPISMDMEDIEDRPLLHFPVLALALLKAAQKGAGLEGAADRLAHDRRHAKEPADVPRAELLRHLDHARSHLAAALLVEGGGGDRLRITARGKLVLAANPHGVDDSVLVEFPEFRDWLKHIHPPHARSDTRGREFQRGWNDHQAGRDLTDNPFQAETAQHVAWEDGWLEAQSRLKEEGGARNLD